MLSARFSFVFASSFFLVVAAGCSTKADGAGAASDSAGNAVVVPAAHDSAATGAAMRADSNAGMSANTASPSVDQQFLRMMSDHHKGLIAIAHETVERKDAITVKGEAETLDKKQDAELDEMVTMLEQQYHDAYAPKVTPDNQAMLDSLKPKSGAAYDRTFRKDIIKHHQAAIAMIDEYAAKLSNPKVKSMADKMKMDQQREIVELQKQVSTGR